MSHRHHAAKLIEKNDLFATYSYTSDAIDEELWGKIKFPLSNPRDFEVIEYVQDGGTKEWQESVCMALASSFERRKSENNGNIPEYLLFVA
ncbi:hypothetical protein FCV66_23410 [Enterovibrio norvegicus]|uniref:hypothetical protein n=1 Tax=Enterovibrio norvegicus TaxID=188144 RepID=UPI000C82AC59|nr:hypothetical protein [Enterovibrio norvegicus]PMI35085.1 hypothetical protein BCU47_23870 [Enterovibrio norvegicus]PMI38094.1 hypothetical protein BCU46_09625 [Enterovibrio norvegicus]TKF06652.1 hypothetical protein FCV66_23410 [Enterovibrio norvegicus]